MKNEKKFDEGKAKNFWPMGQAHAHCVSSPQRLGLHGLAHATGHLHAKIVSTSRRIVLAAAHHRNLDQTLARISLCFFSSLSLCTPPGNIWRARYVLKSIPCSAPIRLLCKRHTCPTTRPTRCASESNACPRTSPERSA